VKYSKTSAWIDQGLLEAERQESRAGRVSYLIEFEALQKFCKEHRSLLITRRVSPYKILFLEEYVVAPKHAELLRTRESKREVEACRTKARISLISQVCDLNRDYRRTALRARSQLTPLSLMRTENFVISLRSGNSLSLRMLQCSRHL